ncbi:MAG: hypothetical protein HY264_04645 [Chloroflexi bacterium]|nr:hypothetical protein [Chloroflexota bacterium]
MRRHDFDALSLLFGLFFAAVGLALLGGTAVRNGLAIPWAGPVVAIGLAVLILIAVRPRTDDADADSEPAGEDLHPT